MVIRVVKANANSLHDVSVKIPADCLTVVTGVSGSGKSSLVRDIIYAESLQRMSSLFPLDPAAVPAKPDVEEVTGLPPAALLRQSQRLVNSRSTVGTKSGLWNMFRWLYAAHNDAGERLSPAQFSFNLEGACEVCLGKGIQRTPDLNKIVDKSKSFNNGAFVFTANRPGTNWSEAVIVAVFEVLGIGFDVPLSTLTEDVYAQILFPEVPFVVEPSLGKFRHNRRLSSEMKYRGLVETAKLVGDAPGVSASNFYDTLCKTVVCEECEGSRLKKVFREHSVGGLTVQGLSLLPVDSLYDELLAVASSCDGLVRSRVEDVAAQAKGYVAALTGLGVGYLSLSRGVNTLSGGEAQRVVMAEQLMADMSGLLYILDEPTAGLHSSDVKTLIKSMRKLAETNTVLVVEHNHEVISAADHIVEMGPGAGVEGGEVVGVGNLSELGDTETGRRMRNLVGVVNNQHRELGNMFGLTGVDSYNLQDVTVSVPANTLTVISGVSGSGKSSLIYNSLIPALKTVKKGSAVANLFGAENVSVVKSVNQSPIGKTSRSSVASYTKLSDHIRDMFAKSDDAQRLGLTKKHFSYNSKGGCPRCGGKGERMVSLPDMPVRTQDCEDCYGSGFSSETLSAHVAGRNIHDVMSLKVSECGNLFTSPKANRIIETLTKVGLGYLSLGQRSNSLSGGEAQRVKLSAELAKRRRKGTLYVLDEPTAGLHFSDIVDLLALVQELVSTGSTVIIIEHNLPVIMSADHVIDLGPGGGVHGGRIVATGTPTEIMEARTLTGIALKEFDQM